MLRKRVVKLLTPHGLTCDVLGRERPTSFPRTFLSGVRVIDRYSCFVVGMSLLLLGVAAQAEENKAGPSKPVPVWCIDFSPDGSMLASAAGEREAEGIVTVWDTHTWAPVYSLKKSRALTCVAFSPDGKRLAVGTQEGDILVVDLATKSIAKRWPSGRTAVYGINWSRMDQRIVAACANGVLALFDSESGETIIRFDVWKADGIDQKAGGHEDRNQWDATVTSDGNTLLSAGWNDTTRLWSIETGEMIASFPDVDKRTQGVKFTPDERHFISSGIGMDCVRIRETATFRERMTLPIVGRDVSVHPGGGLIATNSTSKVVVFAVNLDQPTGSEALRVKSLTTQAKCEDENQRMEAFTKLRNMGPRIEPILFELKKDRGSLPLQLHALYDQFREPTKVAEFNGFEGQVRQVTISPKGDLIAASTTSGEVWTWNIPGFTQNQHLKVSLP